MTVFSLPDDDTWVLHVKDSQGNDVGDITLDQIDQIHSNASQDAKNGDNLLEAATEYFNNHFGRDESNPIITPIIASILLNHKTKTVDLLKKSLATSQD